MSLTSEKPPLFGISEWDARSIGVLAVLLVVSYLITNAIVIYLHQRRLERIEQKAKELWACKSDSPTPVTIVTGFLGSGKTTLLNYILTSPDHGMRVAVIENEFGAVSIDHSLIESGAGPDGRQKGDVIVMKNGCMCCSGESPGSELERVLDQLLRLHSKDSTAGFDYVLIETTGLADPAPIIETLFRHNMRPSPKYYLDGVVTLVDARNIQRHLKGRGFGAQLYEAEAQIAYADSILLNKIDLVEETELKQVRTQIRLVNSTAKLNLAEHSIAKRAKEDGVSGNVSGGVSGDVSGGPLAAVLNLRGYSLRSRGMPGKVAGAGMGAFARVVAASQRPQAAESEGRGESESEVGEEGGASGRAGGGAPRLRHFAGKLGRRADGIGSMTLCYGSSSSSSSTSTSTSTSSTSSRGGARLRRAPARSGRSRGEGKRASVDLKAITGLVKGGEAGVEEGEGGEEGEEAAAGGEVDMALFREWLTQLVQERWRYLYRLKGIVAVRGHDRQFIVHAVHRDVHAQFGAAWAEGAERRSDIVLIGKHLGGAEARDQIRAGFKTCLSRPRARAHARAHARATRSQDQEQDHAHTQ